MPSYSSYSRSSFALLLLSLPVATIFGQLDLIPDGFLDFIPESCMTAMNEALLPCAIQNFCLTLIPSDEEIENIPSEDEIGSCFDVEEALCPITSRCPPCKAQADEVFKCVVLGNAVDGTLSQNVTDLVSSCSLDCNLVAPVAADVVDAEEVSEAPAETPEEEEGSSAAPVAAAGEEEEEDDHDSHEGEEEDHEGEGEEEDSHDHSHDSTETMEAEESGGASSSLSRAVGLAAAAAFAFL